MSIPWIKVVAQNRCASTITFGRDWEQYGGWSHGVSKQPIGRLAFLVKPKLHVSSLVHKTWHVFGMIHIYIVFFRSEFHLPIDC